MKKSTIALIVVGALTLIAVVSSIGLYNNLVSAKENVSTALSNIDAQYQRRADLIPQLVATVEQAVTSERKTLDEVVSARAAATSVTLNGGEDFAAYQEAQSQVTSSLGRLIAISESYPDLKSTAGFLDLQAQLEGTENRITVARLDYNNAAKTYNVATARFPAVILAGMFGHGTPADYFQAEAGSDVAPELNFTDK